MASTYPREASQRRMVRRSRFGCRNCKLRKLKCDESKPQCRRCISFGVLCNFMPRIPDLQPVAGETERPAVQMVGRHAQIETPVASAVWVSDGSVSYQLNAKCQDFITWYLGQSLVTLGDPNMGCVNRGLLKLAFHHPFLMHASLAVALTYDRHLNSPPGARPSLEECYHWSQSIALFNRKLRQPIEAKDKDAIWGTAAALTILTFSSPEASKPEESWPLKSSGHSDLDWLRMSKAKMSLWHIVDPLRPESIFSVMAPTYARMNSPLPERGIDGVPEALAAVCNLTDSSTAESSPYFEATHSLSQMLDLPGSEVTTGYTELFTHSIRGPFKELLWKKDPVALLLLYLWYRKARRSIWFIELRARVECPSLCAYLRLHHNENDAVQAFLPGGVFAAGGG